MGRDRLAALGRLLAARWGDRLTASNAHNLKELRPGSAGRSQIRVVFVFDPWRSATLLLGGDKSGNWKSWYKDAISRAEDPYEVCLKEREQEEADR